MRRIVVTGSESTGKTTLARDLAAHFGTIASPEYSRIYAEANPRELTADDVDPIARGQIAIEDEYARRASGLLVHDTDLVSTMVYASHYYGACPGWIAEAARLRRADLYLLLDVDVPWVPDGVRDRPTARPELHRLFAQELGRLGARVAPIGGGWDARRAAAIRAIERLLQP